jgi:uncharacterized FlgJ-related protein
MKYFSYEVVKKIFLDKKINIFRKNKNILTRNRNFLKKIAKKYLQSEERRYFF